MKRILASIVVLIILLFLFTNNSFADGTTCSVGVSFRIPLVPGLNAPLPNSTDIESKEQTSPQPEPTQKVDKQDSDSTLYLGQTDNLDDGIYYTIYSR